MKKDQSNQQVKWFHLPVIVFLVLLTIQPAFAQQTTTQPDNTYGANGSKETTVGKDEFGRTVTTEKYYDGSEPKKLRAETVTRRKMDNSGTETNTTEYYPNGQKKKTSRYERNDDKTSKLEELEYSDYDGKILGGFIRTYSGGRHTRYEWDPVEKKFKGWGDAKTGETKENNKTGSKAAAELFAGYNFMSRDYDPARINSHGVNGSFTWYFRGGVSETPIGIKVSANTAVHKRAEETISMNTYRVGPVIGFNTGNDRIYPSLQVQAGMARDVFKFEGDKTGSNSFAASAGGNLDWYFTESAGIRIAVETMLTRFNSESQWHFIGSTGVVFRIPVNKNK